jgi:hypothetical protein
MREKMDAMQREFERFFEYLKNHANEFSAAASDPTFKSDALIPISRLRILRTRQRPTDLD